MSDPITLVDCGCRAQAYKDGSGIEIYWCAMHAKAADMESVLEEFIDDINVAGGLLVDADDPLRMAVDPEWTDLAATYVRACDVLDLPPRMEGEGPPRRTPDCAATPRTTTPHLDT